MSDDDTRDLLPDPGVDEADRRRYERYLTWVLAAALAVALVGVVYVSLTPQETGDPFTEFYVLGPGGNASGYPTNLTPGESGEVIVGISNHERREVDYRVVVTWNGTETARREVTVPRGETREFRTTLVAPERPGRYRVRFLLYKLNGSGRIYDFLRLWVVVRESHEPPDDRTVHPLSARSREDRTVHPLSARSREDRTVHPSSARSR